MLSLVPLLLKSRYVIAAIGVIAVLAGLYFFGYNNGVLKARGACEVEKTNAINTNIEIRKKQDRVITLDDVALANSLRRGTF